MPQLDSNTFIYQYFGIIFLLILVYFTLSYLVLPVLLRLILIRNLFLNTRQTLTDLSAVVSLNYQQLINFKNPCHTLTLIDTIVGNFTILLNAWLNLLFVSLVSSGTKKNVEINNTFLSSKVIDYLILFLLVEFEENE